MKKKILLVLSCLFVFTGCSLMKSSPSDEVEKFLNKYKSNDKQVVEELDRYLNTQNLDEEEYEDYKELYLRQYSNMKYMIKDETIDGDTAIVETQITVYDYYKTNVASGEYFTANQADFINDKGDVDLGKYLTYKVNKLLDTTDTVSYTLEFNLTKIDDEWTMDGLTNDELSKLHGTYEY